MAEGRVIRGADAARAVPVRANLASHAARRVSAAESSAAERARALVAAAESRALAIVTAAERDASEIRTVAKSDGRAEGFAETTALAVELRARAAEREERALGDAVELARLLAERLVGHVLSEDPGTVAHLAKTALAEARGARRVVLVANPEDANVLRPVLGAIDAEGRLAEVRGDPLLRRGDLRLETDVGIVEARVGAALDRLAQRLGEALAR
ncbi:MAG TPA: FliH/SctL family protein [Polyangiaceae bacterium]|nr:FliH/SctL family protein [Polyangiaceae bacterium]